MLSLDRDRSIPLWHLLNGNTSLKKVTLGLIRVSAVLKQNVLSGLSKQERLDANRTL